MRKNAGILTVIAILVACGVAGCAATGTAPAGEAAPSSSSEPVAGAAWPTQLVPTSCDKLVPQSTLDGVFGAPLQLGVEIPAQYDVSRIFSAAIENSGSLSCSWGVASTSDGSNSPQAVSVVIVPRGPALLDRINAELDAVSGVGSSVSCLSEVCALRGLEGEYWIDATIWSSAHPAEGASAEMLAVFDSVVTAAQSLAPSSDPAWPAEAASWPTRCDEFVSAETLETGLNLPGATFASAFGYEGSNIALGAVLGARGLVCGIADANGAEAGRILTVPAAGDLFAAARDQQLLTGDVTAVEVAGLESGSAFVRQDPLTSTRTSLEMNDDGTWVELSYGAIGGTDSATVTQLVQLAEAIVAD